MTKPEFNEAFTIADDPTIDLTEEFKCEGFDGFGLPSFEQITCTKRQVAGLIRYQAHCFNGNWDIESLTEIQKVGRHKFQVV